MLALLLALVVSSSRKTHSKKRKIWVPRRCDTSRGEKHDDLTLRKRITNDISIGKPKISDPIVRYLGEENRKIRHFKRSLRQQDEYLPEENGGEMAHGSAKGSRGGSRFAEENLFGFLKKVIHRKPAEVYYDAHSSIGKRPKPAMIV